MPKIGAAPRSSLLRVLLAFCLVTFSAGRAEAYPWMIKHGYFVCGTCHSDPAGGELLTAYGRVISESVLSSHFHESEAAPAAREGHEFFQPYFAAVRVPDALLIGGSVRFATLYRDTPSERVRAFPMQLDGYGDYGLFAWLHFGGSLGLAKVPVGSPHARAAQLTTNQGDGYNLLSRTHYLRYEFGGGAHSLSLGRLNLPFGLRMSEHVMWVRSETATDRESDQQHGLALDLNFDTLRFGFMAIAGNYQLNPDKLRKRGYSAYLELSPWSGTALGASSLITHAGADALAPTSLTDTRQAHGLFGRSSLGREFVLMAEADLLLHTQHKPGYVGFVDLDFEAFRGFHLDAIAEVLDSGYSKTDDGAPRVAGEGKPKLGTSLRAQWFFVSHFDVRLDAIRRQNEPFQLLGQVHVYL